MSVPVATGRGDPPSTAVVAWIRPGRLLSLGDARAAAPVPGDGRPAVPRAGLAAWPYRPAGARRPCWPPPFFPIVTWKGSV